MTDRQLLAYDAGEESEWSENCGTLMGILQ